MQRKWLTLLNNSSSGSSKGLLREKSAFFVIHSSGSFQFNFFLLNFCLQLNKSSLDFEHSEMLLYQNMIHRESGRKKEALDHLDKYENYITDKLQVKELKGMCTCIFK